MSFRFDADVTPWMGLPVRDLNKCSTILKALERRAGSKNQEEVLVIRKIKPLNTYEDFFFQTESHFLMSRMALSLLCNPPAFTSSVLELQACVK